MRLAEAIAISVVLTAANFSYQAINDQLWSIATERSYFQTSALLIAWLCLAIRRNVP